MADPTPPRRRWFQFGMASMFVVVAILAVPAAWIGYNLNWIRQRQALIARERALQADHLDKRGWRLSILPTDMTPPTPPPRILGLLGEDGYSFISLLIQVHSTGSMSEEERAKVDLARSLFPEATVRTIHFYDLRPFGHGETIGKPD